MKWVLSRLSFSLIKIGQPKLKAQMVDDDNRKAGSDAHGRAKAFVTECNLIENCINLMQKEGCHYFAILHYFFACELLKTVIGKIKTSLISANSCFYLLPVF